jgi:protein-L-isoaspartate(D-aspartate) O-methyltransferase
VELESTPQDESLNIPALHQALVDSLKENQCIQTGLVEAAFRAVPRHLFLPEHDVKEVYEDKAIVTKHDEVETPISSSSQPAIMAIMLEQLDLQPGHRVLEIGAGTGYNAALIAQIVGENGSVATVDIDEDIVAKARENLRKTGFERVVVVCGDGAEGYPDDAPYDRIILTVGAWDVFPAWLDQLKVGGRVVLPLTIRWSQRSVAFERTENGLQSVSVKNCGFMRMRGAFAEPQNLHSLWTGVRLWSDWAVDVDAISQALLDSYHEIPTGLNMDSTPWGLIFWLELYEPGFGQFWVKDAPADAPQLPYLWGVQNNFHAMCISNGERLVFLMRSPGRTPPKPEDAGKDKPPFELHIRCYGQDNTLVDTLLDHIRAWDEAGRPRWINDLHITAYPVNAELHVPEDAIVLPRRWMQYVLELRAEPTI